MLHAATFTFLTDLRANNNKAWLDANRPAYEAAKADFLELVTQVLGQLEASDPAIAESHLQPKKCVFRLNRDIRFSTDKTPYKTNFGAWFNAGGKALASAGYYLNLEPGGSFVAGGMYMPEAKTLATLRQEIDYNLPAFEALLTAPEFRRHFAGLSQEHRLQRPPKGYDAANPALNYLRLKSFTASHALPDAALQKPGASQQITAAFAALQPLVGFLNQGLD
ncbi:DUF2461 domain-containing protein [Hymenobacter chitinivorans]|uniref:Uncharacterized protein (TIGR02453 family) n=1 Tax=Hymenobacter chitinivorans DSM 11115 TaxID=1121954 RepID=A0A2M9BSM5_9BACT|nr:DUF2461 domain-containing protein [Hymenobacter chitinivorans]PJJ60960.1 uncharacterized protein (TIGR02453 family) [Hymenobacter chitinivorans DSM 11115]